MFNTKKILNKIFLWKNIFFFTVDHLFKKIVIFSWKYILEVSIIDRWWIIKKSKYFYFYIRKFDDINNLYNFIDWNNFNTELKISSIINLILSYEDIIYKIFIKDNLEFFNNTFQKSNIKKDLLLILRWWWMEETIEKSFIWFCSNSNLKLTVLYKYWTWYWWQKLNQWWFFSELESNFKNIKFIYNEDFDDNYIDSIINEETIVYSFQYDYKWKYSNLNMIILSSVSNWIIDLSKYKNIFSCYHGDNIWYSTDKFINFENVNIYKIFNPQNINLIHNYSIITPISDFILSWWMSWARDFSILNSLNWKYKWIIISDEIHDIKNFLSFYRWIQSYYWFLGAFILSKVWIFCHIDEFNDDDRSKMISSAICSSKPVLIPNNNWNIVKDVIGYKLWDVYLNNNISDFNIKFYDLYDNQKRIDMISKNSKIYSEENMDVNKFINFIFTKI